MAATTKLDVITGFLGAGKTTFLQHYCAWLKQNGISFAVIENEFGQAGVDAALLSACDITADEIAGGCVCCTLKTVLYQKIEALCGKVDRILLEPSGLFCGDDLVEILRAPELQGRLALGMWLGVVDPLCLPVLQPQDREVLLDELIWAGSILLSKTQLCSEEELAEAVTLLQSLLPAPMPLLLSSPWEQLTDADFTALQQSGTVQRPHLRVLRDHTRQFQSTALRVRDVGHSKEALAKRLAALFAEQEQTVLRMKGSVTQNGIRYLINCTPQCISVEACEGDPSLPLNVIGRGLNRKAMLRILEEETP